MDVCVEVPSDLNDADPVILASFSNGQLHANAGQCKSKFTVYQKQDQNKRRKVLVAETHHMTYVGTNYPTEGGLSTGNLCRYFVGAVDHETHKMTLHRTEMFTMKPYIEGRTDAISLEEDMEKEVNFRQTFDQMVTSFGSERAKKALSAAKRNKIENTLLDTVMAPAVSLAEEKAKRVEELPQEQIQTSSSLIPPCNTAATSPKDVYNLDDIIPLDELEGLTKPALELSKLTPEEMNDFPRFVVSHLSSLPSGGSSLQQSQLLLYCTYLITLFQQTPKQIEKKGLSHHSWIPASFQHSLLRKFTESSQLEERGKHHLSQRMKDKILSHLFVLALMIDCYTLDTTLIQQDLKISSAKVLNVCRALGCTMAINSQQKTQADKLTPKTYTATLKLPLNFPRDRKTRPK